MKKTSLIYRSILLLLALTSITDHVGAQSYPDRPIKLIVPWAAGSSSGNWARLIAEPLAKDLGQPIVIEHRPGATGTIGGALVANAKPDGYTLLYGITADQAVAPHVLRNMSYDPRVTFAAVSLLLEAPTLLVSSDSRITTISDLVGAAKARPGELSFGTVGQGSQGHLYWEVFMRKTGTRLIHVPYKGQAEVVPDLLGGRVGFTYLWPSMVTQHRKAGKLFPLITTNAKRLPDFPDVPTASEVGLAELESTVWAGVLAPVATPKDVIARLNGAIRKVMGDASLRAALVKTDAQARTSSPEEFAQLVRNEWERWGRAVKAANIQLE